MKRYRYLSSLALVSLLSVACVAGTDDQETTGQSVQPLTGGFRYDDMPDIGQYVVDGRKWDHTNLKYFFENGTDDIAGSDEQNAFRQALALWSSVTPLTFTQVFSAGQADIVLRWATGNHGDGYPFDGAGGVLAHGFYPPPNGGVLAGDIHFDDAETWSTNAQASSAQPIDLVTVAAHEIGHVLGLAHSADSTALMYPYYSASHRFLSTDDLAGIDTVYGSGSTGSSAVMAGNRLTVFARLANGSLVHKYYENGWTEWISIPSSVTIDSDPSAVMAGGRLTVFARGSDGRLLHRFYEGGWTDWIPLTTGRITSSPTAVMAGGRLTVFARGEQGNLVHAFYDNGWTNLIPLGTEPITSAPAAVMAGSRLTVFARDRQGRLTHKFYDGGWSDDIPLTTGSIGSGLSAVMAGSRLTVFFKTAGNTLGHMYYENGWTDTLPLGTGALDSDPDAMMAGNRLVVFGRLADGRLLQKYYDNGWTDWLAF